MVDLDVRMKRYEDAYRIYLPERMPVIIRLDGRAFHTLTRSCERPYDTEFQFGMQITAQFVLSEVQNARIAYVQSDEISILMNNWATLETESWFRNNLQKIVSISASAATRGFTNCYWGRSGNAMFDSRVMVLPKEEVCNYFIWRQRDAEVNSIQMLAQSMFSQSELYKKSCTELKDMVLQSTGKRWEDQTTVNKRGACVTVNGIDREIPIFSKDRDYIERHLVEG